METRILNGSKHMKKFGEDIERMLPMNVHPNLPRRSLLKPKDNACTHAQQMIEKYIVENGTELDTNKIIPLKPQCFIHVTF